MEGAKAAQTDRPAHQRMIDCLIGHQLDWDEVRMRFIFIKREISR